MTLASFIAQLGYTLLGGLFVFGAFDHYANFAKVKAMLVARNWPAPGALLAAASVLELVAGLCLVFGIQRPLAALGLAGFTLLASLLLLDFWNFEGPERDGMRSGFLVNVGLLGGFCLAIAAGI